VHDALPKPTMYISCMERREHGLKVMHDALPMPIMYISCVKWRERGLKVGAVTTPPLLHDGAPQGETRRKRSMLVLHGR